MKSHDGKDIVVCSAQKTQTETKQYNKPEPQTINMKEKGHK